MLASYAIFSCVNSSLPHSTFPLGRKKASEVYYLVVSVVLWSLNWWREKNCLLFQLWPHAELQKETQGWVCEKPCDNSLLTNPRAAAFLPHYCFSGFIMLSSFFPFAHLPFVFSQRSHYQFSHLASHYLRIWSYIFMFFSLLLLFITLFFCVWEGIDKALRTPAF